MRKKNIPGLKIGLIVLSLLLCGQSCNFNKPADSAYYTTEDFQKVSKVDIHVHIITDRTAFLEQAVVDSFRLLTIVTDLNMEGAPPIAVQQNLAIFQQSAFPDNLDYLTSFTLDGWEEEDWPEKTIALLKESLDNGALGVKVWKNIGMVEKDKDDKFIKIDDPKFDPVFDFLTEIDMPVCGHIGEPRNCWLPMDEMTVNNDKSYYQMFPQYHMYLHPEYPAYEEHIIARDNMLEKHPELHFMGAHLGSLEWDIDEVASRLDRFPHMTVDLAARISHLQVQSREDRQKVHDFFVKYADRILYGTDMADSPIAEPDPEIFKKNCHDTWLRDWEYLVSDHTMTSPEVEGEFKGLKLPAEVIDKIYYRNAIKLFFLK
jgi:predicted TIM-barrel fold metal-dependent hydrolase